MRAPRTRERTAAGSVAWAVALLLGMGACSGTAPATDVAPATNAAPSTDVAPSANVAPAASTASDAGREPLAWFAENWGPFDPTVTGSSNGRRMPLLLVDGRQVDRRTGDNGLLASLAPEDVAVVRAIKCPADLSLFGAAGDYGIIMIFTTAYDGPIPADRTMADAARCTQGVQK